MGLYELILSTSSLILTLTPSFSHINQIISITIRGPIFLLEQGGIVDVEGSFIINSSMVHPSGHSKKFELYAR